MNIFNRPKSKREQIVELIREMEKVTKVPQKHMLKLKHLESLEDEKIDKMYSVLMDFKESYNELYVKHKKPLENLISSIDKPDNN